MQPAVCLDTDDQNYSLQGGKQAGLVHPGLPAPLPPGERVVWQGAPDASVLTRRLYHTRFFSLWFAFFAAWQFLGVLGQSADSGQAVFAAVLILLSGLVALGLFSLIGGFTARGTIYTLTNKRIIMRIGASFTKSIDIPFAIIESATLKKGPGNTGDIALQLKPGNTIPYLVLWPHVRPWRYRYTEPMLRSVPLVDEVSAKLVHLLSALGNSSDGLADESACSDTQSGDAGVSEQQPEKQPISGSNPAGRLPVFATVAVVLLTLAFVAVNQLTDQGTSLRDTRVPDTVYQLRFMDLGEDRIAIHNDQSNEVIATIEPGRDNVLRGALRGLDRTREQLKLVAGVPYQLVLWDSGQLTLSDLETDRHFPLDSFGYSKAGATAVLRNMKKRNRPAKGVS